MLFGIAAYGGFANLYYAQLGLSGRQIGLLAGLGPAVAFAAQPFWARIADRKLGSASTLTMVAVCSAAVALIYPVVGSFLLLVLLVTADQFFTSSMTPLTNTVSMSAVAASKGRTSYATLRLFGSLGYSVSTYVLGYVLAATSLVNLFYWKAGATVAVALTALKLREIAPRQKTESKSGKNSGVWALLASAPIRTAVGAYYLLALSLTLGMAFLGLYVKDLGGDPHVVGLAYTVSSLSAVPAFLTADRLRKSLGLYPSLLLVVVVSTLRWGLTAVAPTPSIVVVVQVLHGLTFVLQYVGIVNFAYAKAPEEAKAGAMSLIAVGQAVSQTAAGLLGGLLYEAWGGRGVCIGSLAASLIAALILLGGRRHLDEEVGPFFRKTAAGVLRQGNTPRNLTP